VGHRLIKHGEGLYAIFSDVVDDLICTHCTREEVIAAYVNEATKQARAAAEAWLDGTAPGRRFWSVEEIVETIGAVHGPEKAERRRQRLELKL
jgi:hypothetical protein